MVLTMTYMRAVVVLLLLYEGAPKYGNNRAFIVSSPLARRLRGTASRAHCYQHGVMTPPPRAGKRAHARRRAYAPVYMKGEGKLHEEAVASKRATDWWAPPYVIVIERECRVYHFRLALAAERTACCRYARYAGIWRRHRRKVNIHTPRNSGIARHHHHR